MQFGVPAIPINGRAKTSALWVVVLIGVASRCAGFEPLGPCASEPPTLRLYQFSAIGPISNPFHKPGAHRILIHIDSLFDGVFKANGCDDETIRPATGNRGSLAIVLLPASSR